MPNNPKRNLAHEPLYEVHPKTGATIEIFHADDLFAGMGAGWFWWTCQAGSKPEWRPRGPFGTSYRAYCDAIGNPGQQGWP